MDLATLKSKSRPRRSPREGPLEIKRFTPNYRDKDVMIGIERYKIKGRSPTKITTHWVLVSLTDGSTIELTENEVIEALAKETVRKMDLGEFLGGRELRGAKKEDRVAYSFNWTKTGKK